MAIQTAPTMPAPTNALAKTDERHLDTNSRAREIASRLKYMIVNGRNLADAEVFALAQYSAANDLNPFAGEAYYLPGSGPCPGIAGWRKKAQEQLNWEAAQQNTTAYFWVEDRPATHEEARFDETAGDIAIVVTLHDFLSTKSWRREYFDAMRQLKGFNVPDAELKSEAGRMVGPEPVWTGIGIVYGTEKFGGTEKYAREERAKKRAEKIALRKRFPRIHLPEPAGFIEAEDAIEVSFKSEQTPEPEPATQYKILSDLGIADGEAPAEPTPPPASNLPPLRYTPEKLKARIAELAATMTGQVSNGKRWSVKTTLETIFSQSPDPSESRHQLQHYLTGCASIKDMPDATILALHKWLNPKQDSGGAWVADGMAEREALAVIVEAQPKQDGLF